MSLDKEATLQQEGGEENEAEGAVDPPLNAISGSYVPVGTADRRAHRRSEDSGWTESWFVSQLQQRDDVVIDNQRR
jgi:hypothetical protein